THRPPGSGAFAVARVALKCVATTRSKSEMTSDDRFYAFIISHTSRSRSQIRRFCVEKRWLKGFAGIALLLVSIAGYGFYGLTQQAVHFQIEVENQRLKAENEAQRRELNELNNRVQRVEDTSRKLAEKSGVVHEETVLPGTGGPALPLDEPGLALLETKMSH